MQAADPSTDATPFTGTGELDSEAALAARAAEHPECFGQLYDLYVQRIYRYAYTRLSSHEDAEDVTAQTFRKALEGLSGYRWRGVPFGAWLFRIAHNCVVDRYRVRRTTASLDELDGHPAGTDPAELPEAVLVAKEEADGAWSAVATLPPLQRRAVVLRFGRDLSHAEVGVLIGRSEAATKQLIYRAMKTLREQLAGGVSGG